MRVRITGIKEYKDRHGTLRRYYRRKGAPSIAIPTNLKGQALSNEIARLDAIHAPLTPVAGTLRILISEYMAKSQHWAKLRPRTRKDYERVFAWLGDSQDHDLSVITTPALAALRDKANDQHGYKFANQVLVCFTKLFAFALEQGCAKSNPAKDVSAAYRPESLPTANTPWEPMHTKALLAALPIHLKGPTALAAYLGIRRGDVVRMPVIALKNEILSFETSKTRTKLELPICDDLGRILQEYLTWRDALIAKNVNNVHPTALFLNTRATKWTDDGFGTSFEKARNRAVDTGMIPTGMTFHGARHGVATILAEQDFEAHQTKLLLGHGSNTITEHYSKRAKRRSLLQKMANAVQETYRNEGSNITKLDDMRNKSV